MRIVLTGGGTGGHIMPFESIVEALRATYKQELSSLPSFLEPEHLEIYFFGVTTPASDELFKKYSVPVRHIPSGKMRRYASALNILDILWFLPIGILIAIIRMWQVMPDIVVSKGGYGSIPSVLAATLYRIPIILHESDAVPGAANSSLMRFASAITLGFAVSREYLQQWGYKLFVTGTPVRVLMNKQDKAGAKKTFEIPESETVLLVMGGSQGAQQINEALLAILPTIIEKMAVIHITGEAGHDAVVKVANEFIAKSSRKDLYKPFPYLAEKMSTALLATDIAVSRAGASSLSEIAHLRIPSVIIPLDSAANDHQRKNALAFEASGGALVLEPNNLSPHLLEQSVMRLFSDPSLKQTLSNNLAALDFPNSALDIAKLTFQLASGFRPKKK